MLKRTLVFSSPMILSLKNQQLVLAYKDSPDEKQTVPIEDVGVVLLEHQQTSVTLPLLNALAENEVQVVICNSKGMPSAMLQSMNSNNLQGETLRNQIACGEVLKKQLWKQVVEAKIRNQASLLDNVGENGNVLKPFYNNVRSQVHIKRVKGFVPEKGHVSVLSITDKQYSNIIHIWGSVEKKSRPTPLQIEFF